LKISLLLPSNTNFWSNAKISIIKVTILGKELKMTLLNDGNLRFMTILWSITGFLLPPAALEKNNEQGNKPCSDWVTENTKYVLIPFSSGHSLCLQRFLRHQFLSSRTVIQIFNRWINEFFF
jgi:hypothetical protein